MPKKPAKPATSKPVIPLGFESIPSLDIDDVRYLQSLCATILASKDLRKRFVDEIYEASKPKRSTLIRCEAKLRDLILKRRLVPNIDITPTQLLIKSQSEKIDIRKHG
jgi:hypothetical protein